MRRQGVLFGVAAYLLWGGFPLYFPLLEPAGTFEILASRVVFSALFVGLLLTATGRIRSLARLGRRALTRLAVAAVLIAVNWGVYIYAVNHHHIVETSLGYFINPLLTVALGVVILGERLRRAQWYALGLGLLAVAVITVSYGRPPYLALVLAASFGTYGLVKKRVGVPAPEGLFVEAGVLFIPATITLAVLAASGHGSYTGHGSGHDLLLVGSGLATAVPLLFFAGAANRLPLTTLGLLQYLAPVLQLGIAVGLKHEPLPGPELAGFALVWVALAILSVDGLRRRTATAPTPLDELVPAG